MQSLRTRTRTAFKSYPHATQGSDCTRAVAVRGQHSDYFCWRSWLATRRTRSVCFYPSRVLLCLCLCMLLCVFFVSISSKATRTHLINPPWPGIWAKHSNFHLATNAPFAIHVPGTQPQVSPQYAEFVDLFPTIVEAATGASMPACPKRSCNVKFCTQGVSLLPHIKDHR